MNDHERIRTQLSAAAAGLLSDVELRRVQKHARACESCRRELDYWLSVTQGLGELPQPSFPAGLLERTQALVLQELEPAERSHLGWLMAGLVLWGWLATAGLVAAARVFIGGWSPLLWFAAWSVLAFMTAGTAAMVLGNRALTLRRNHEHIIS